LRIEEYSQKRQEEAREVGLSHRFHAFGKWTPVGTAPALNDYWKEAKKNRSWEPEHSPKTGKGQSGTIRLNERGATMRTLLLASALSLACLGFAAAPKAEAGPFTYYVGPTYYAPTVTYGFYPTYVPYTSYYYTPYTSYYSSPTMYWGTPYYSSYYYTSPGYYYPRYGRWWWR
jgi:hypothetical protein